MDNIIYLFKQKQQNKTELIKNYFYNSDNKNIINLFNYFFNDSIPENSNITFINEKPSDKLLNYSFVSDKNSISMIINNFKYAIEINNGYTMPTLNLFKFKIDNNSTNSLAISIPQIAIIELEENPLNTGSKNLNINFNEHCFSYKIPIFNLYSQNVNKLRKEKLDILINLKEF